MGALSVHLRIVALMRHSPIRRPGFWSRDPLIARGLAWHGGEEAVELRTDDEESALLCVIPGEVLARALPVMGRLAKWYPDTDFYIVVGDAFDAELELARRDRER